MALKCQLLTTPPPRGLRLSVESTFAGVFAPLTRLLVFISTIHDDFTLY
jgi:hypothetical protein